VIIKSNKKRTRYTLEIDNDANLIVKTPINPSKKYINKLVNENIKWIEENQFKVNSMKQSLLDWFDDNLLFYRGKKYKLSKSNSQKVIFKEQEVILPKNQSKDLFLSKHAKLYLPERCLDILESMNLECSKIKIRRLKSCWGTCNINKTITLNKALIQSPDWVSDYVIIHECAHLVHFNHSKDFWALVSKYTNHTKAAKKWLKDHQIVLIS